MSSRRGKKKRKQPLARSAGQTAAAAPKPRSASAPPERPPRLDVRDGIRRPEPIWAPFPLTEIALVIGIVIFVLGVFGAGNSAAFIGGGLVILTVTVAEMCIREHFSGFRSHTLLLALLPVAIGHTLVLYLVTDSWRGLPALSVDLAAFAGLALLLHRRYRSARARAGGAAR